MLSVVYVLFFCAVEAHGVRIIESLKDTAWQEVLDAGGMHVGSGRVKRFVEVAANQSNIPYQACLLPDGKPGHCRHLQHCLQEDFKSDVTKFLDYICIINRNSIGVCCPDDVKMMKSGFARSLTGDFPATAPINEDNELDSNNLRSNDRGCGASTRPHGRLVGARPANPQEWPWMASITPEGMEQYCGGVLITDRHVLTAAHCVRRWKIDELFVRLGEYDFKLENDSRSFNFRVVEKRMHAGFDHNSYNNDIAILKLHRPAVLNSYVWPVCLPPPGLELVNKSAVVIGWGTQFYGGPHSTVLMEVTIPVWEHQTCVNSFTEAVYEENLCAGAYEGGKDSCQGDSGGPLLYQVSTGRWAVIGVVSWGVKCGEANHPGIYIRVDKYLQWILDNVQF